MNHNERIGRLAPPVRIALAGVSVFVVLLFVITAFYRLHNGFDLEQFEGYMTLSVHHLANGGKFYTKPDFKFIANLYPPVFYYTSVAIGKLMGGWSFAATRMVSILSTLGAFLMIFLTVRLDTRRWLAALAAVGMYAGAYTVCEEWFDVGRLDSMYVFVILLALYCTRRFHPAVAALVWIVAVQTKQPILPVALVMLCFDYKEYRRTITGLAVFIAGTAATIFALIRISGGWYGVYIFEEPKANSSLLLRPGVLFPFNDVMRPFGLVCIVVAAAILLTHPRFRSKATRFYLATLSIVFLTWLQMLHNGSAANILMPMYALLALAFGVSVGRLVQMYEGTEYGPLAETLVFGAAAIQIAGGIYNPGAYKGTETQRASVKAVVSVAHAFPGDVYMPQHPYYGVLAGKPEHPDIASLRDVLATVKPQEADALRRDIARQLCDGEIQAMMFDRPADADDFAKIVQLGPDWKSSYAAPQRIPGTDLGFRPAWVFESTAAGHPASESCVHGPPTLPPA